MPYEPGSRSGTVKLDQDPTRNHFGSTLLVLQLMCKDDVMSISLKPLVCIIRSQISTLSAFLEASIGLNPQSQGKLGTHCRYTVPLPYKM